LAKICGVGDCRPRNWLVPVILLLLREGSSYGYELMERAAAFGFEALNAGTVYRTLKHMEKNGAVESSWDTTKRSGPARRMYSITAYGKDQLNFWAKALEQYQTATERFFRIYQRLPAVNAS
jgi:PadR family transcriptional regulator, regulatory protein PadR